MSSKNTFVKLSTLGAVGYLPAPGTVASLLALLPIYFFSFFGITEFAYGVVTAFVVFFSFYIIGKALDHFRLRNPSEIVLDEVVGCFITFCCVPCSFFTLAIGFIAFRFFDIFKPFGIKKCDFLYGSLGVVMDDILAGVFANIVIRIALYFL